MVRFTASFNKTSGRVYLIPLDLTILSSRKSDGGDLGVFDDIVSLDSDILNIGTSLLFRVQYGLVSPSKFKWIDKGMFPFKDSLFRSQPYLYRPVGVDECYLVTYETLDELVNCAEASSYEPLATWSHEYIVRRFLRQSKAPQ